MTIVRMFLLSVLAIGFGLGRCSMAHADEVLIQHAKKMEEVYQLPKGLLVSICKAESNWKNVRGQLDEIGVCQLRPSTIRLYFPRNIPTYYYKIGARGVRHIQYRMAVLGYYKGTIDGRYEQETVLSVIQYQRSRALSPDGIIGPKTYTSLFGDIKNSSLEYELWQPKENIEYAAMYLAKISRVLKTNDRAILATAFNSGPDSAAVKYLRKVL